MEYVEVFRNKYELPHNKKYVSVHHEWRLTDEEKNEIRNILKDRASQGAIREFIPLLQGLCATKKILLEQPSRSEVRLARERILTDCKAVLGHLKQHEITWYDEAIDPLWGHQPEQEKICPECKHPFKSFWREKCVQCDRTAKAPPRKEEISFIEEYLDSSWAVVGPLEKIIKILEKYHKEENKKIGRKKAGSDHFILKIRDIYSEFIGKPTLYEDGPFFAVVQAVLRMLDLPYDDPSRAIRAALKKA